MTKRRNGECSIFPYRTGYAAYAWVTTPDGERKRKWVYGKTHEEVHEKWIKLQARARQGPMPTTTPALATYLSYWLDEVVQPNLAPKTSQGPQAPHPALPRARAWSEAAGSAAGPGCPNVAEQSADCVPVLRSAQGRSPTAGPAAMLCSREMLSSGPWGPDYQGRARHPPSCPEQCGCGGTDQPKCRHGGAPSSPRKPQRQSWSADEAGRNSWNRPAPTAMLSMPHTSSSSFSASGGVKCSGSPGLTLISKSGRSIFAGSFSVLITNCAIVRPRPNRRRPFCLSQIYA